MSNNIPGLAELRAILLASDNPAGAEGAINDAEAWADNLTAILRGDGAEDRGLRDPTTKAVRRLVKDVTALRVAAAPPSKGFRVRIESTAARTQARIDLHGKLLFQATGTDQDGPNEIKGLSVAEMVTAYPGFGPAILMVGDGLAQLCALLEQPPVPTPTPEMAPESEPKGLPVAANPLDDALDA